MGAFAGSNYDSVVSLNKEIEEKEQELWRFKQEQYQANEHHKNELQNLKNNYEDQLKHLQEKNDLLKQNLEETPGPNVKHVEKITTLEQQLEDFQFIYVASSFSKFTKEEFQELASNIQHDFNKVMVCLFEGLNVIQETYNSF